MRKRELRRKLAETEAKLAKVEAENARLNKIFSAKAIPALLTGITAMQAAQTLLASPAATEFIYTFSELAVRIINEVEHTEDFQ